MLPMPPPPAQLTEEGWQRSLELALDAGPHHISTYDLQARLWGAFQGAMCLGLRPVGGAALGLPT